MTRSRRGTRCRPANAGGPQRSRVSASARSLVPVDRAGCYVPGGRAPLASSVLMTALPARVAGVRHEVVLCTPPAARRHRCTTRSSPRGARRGRRGLPGRGAQAIAALAYGTETIAAVDVIVGPGNAYVAEAKRQVAADVAIDGYAGPSEVAVVADARSLRCWWRRTCSRRSSTARAARPRSSPGRKRSAPRSSASWLNCSRRTTPRPRPRRRCARAGGGARGRARTGDGGRQHDRARAPRARCAPTRRSVVPLVRRCRARCSSAPTRRR